RGLTALPLRLFPLCTDDGGLQDLRIAAYTVRLPPFVFL
nr:hypothetical protein [Tanacetum cinerariifolium]